MKKLLSLLIPLLVMSLYSCTKKVTGPEISVPIEKYSLENGLTVILHEDKSDPLLQLQ